MTANETLLYFTLLCGAYWSFLGLQPYASVLLIKHFVESGFVFRIYTLPTAMITVFILYEFQLS